MSIKVRGFLQDVGGASRVTKLREENFAKGSPIPDPHDPIRELADKLHMRFGVFSNAQQEADIEERFVRAKIAADRVKDDPQVICGYYDLG